MGRTPVPLIVAVWVAWLDHPAVRALADKGHQIVPLAADADLILHPRAHWWCESWFDEPFGTARLEVALRAARQRARGTKA